MLERPSVTLNIVGSTGKSTNSTHRVLIIGEIGNTSTAITDKIIKDVQTNDLLQFGEDSQLFKAIGAYREVNTINKLDVLPIAKGSSTATADITVSEDAINDSKVKIHIGGEFVEINISKGDTKDVVATLIETAFTGSKLFTTTVASNVVTLTAIQPSASINNLSIVVKDISNSGCAITTTKFLGGASTTLADDYLSGITIDERYQSIIFDYANGNNAVRLYLENNFNLTNNINDGVGFSTIKDSITNFKSALNAENYKCLVLFGNLDEMEYDTFSLSATAEIVAIRALRLTPKANIYKYVLSGSLELEGGMSMATLPYFNTPLTFAKPTGVISENQLIELTALGGSVWTHNGTTVLSEVTTTYSKDAGGNNDDSWKFLNYIDTMSTIREYIVINLRKRYGQVRLTDGDLVAGKQITNIGAIKATVLKLYNDLADVVITRKGFNKYVSQNMTIDEDLATGYVTLQLKVPIVTQLRGIKGNVIEVLNITTKI